MTTFYVQSRRVVALEKENADLKRRLALLTEKDKRTSEWIRVEQQEAGDPGDGCFPSSHFADRLQELIKVRDEGKETYHLSLMKDNKDLKAQLAEMDRALKRETVGNLLGGYDLARWKRGYGHLNQQHADLKRQLVEHQRVMGEMKEALRQLNDIHAPKNGDEHICDGCAYGNRRGAECICEFTIVEDALAAAEALEKEQEDE